MKSEILKRLKELADSENALSHQKEFFELRSQYQNLLEHGIAALQSAPDIPEQEIEVEIKVDEGPESVSEEEPTGEQISAEPKEYQEKNENSSDGDATAENHPVETNSELINAQKELTDITSNFKNKIKTLKEAKAKLEKETVEEAKKILSEMKELVAQEENIGKAFARFKEIMDHWKALPKVSNDDYRDLNIEYNKYVEQFFYNINIYKELKELDLKRNLGEKRTILDRQKKLLDENDIRLLEMEVRVNQDRWNEIGPTYKEEWDKIKVEFWETTRGIYNKIQEFYDSRREEQQKNLASKKSLLERVRHIVSLELKSSKKWQDKSNEIKEIQKEWKMIGFVPKAYSSEIWIEFKKLCDSFFENKRRHFDSLRTVQNENKEKKLSLLEKAVSLKDSENWKETSDALILLQKQWKEIGPAHQRDENKLWRQFREACDAFFQKRNEHRAGRGDRELENLKNKEALLTEIKAWLPEAGKQSENISALKAFGDRYRQIGFVPFREKDRIGAAYKEVMDKKYGALDVDAQERKKIRLEEKLESIMSSDQSDVLLRKERTFIQNKITKLQSDITQFENNMGFFAASKGADKLKEDIERKIGKAKKEIDALKEQLSLIKNA